jgi:hypothetical protein
MFILEHGGLDDHDDRDAYFVSVLQVNFDVKEHNMMLNYKVLHEMYTKLYQARYRLSALLFLTYAYDVPASVDDLESIRVYEKQDKKIKRCGR